MNSGDSGKNPDDHSRSSAQCGREKKNELKTKSAMEYIDCVNVCIVTDDALQSKC